MIRLLKKYFLNLLKYNLFLSALGGWFGTSLGRNFGEFFLLTFVSLGFTGSLYFYNYFQANEYYFYYNRGIGKRTLNTAAGVANLLLCSAAYAMLRLTGAISQGRLIAIKDPEELKEYHFVPAKAVLGSPGIRASAQPPDGK